MGRPLESAVEGEDPRSFDAVRRKKERIMQGRVVHYGGFIWDGWVRLSQLQMKVGFLSGRKFEQSDGIAIELKVERMR
jgi:hypothetical protein